MTRAGPSHATAHDLDNEDRVRVLGIIDQFRKLGINEDISLPQLVVVGDQSSGKSSLLEGLTGLSFPIASELCTRFATQIVLRRSIDGHKAVSVSILPSSTSKSDEALYTRLQAFSRELNGDALTGAVFASILNEAALCMGLPGTDETNVDNLPKRFADDVLRIELSGPDHHHLSVVDVPGLFHNPTRFQTEEDLGIIHGLLKDYLSDQRTIILAVMDAKNNLANQEVFRLARAADPNGKRTVGIITKCDAVGPGDEQAIINIAMNKTEVLAHGWFAVRNRSTQEIKAGVSLEARNRNESAFFNQAPFNAISRDRTGIKALKKFLGKLLYDHIRGEFPSLVQDIRTRVTMAREELIILGPPRATAVQQRQYLTQIATSYQVQVLHCLSGGYDHSWDADDPRKLRMHLQALNEKFSRELTKNGHKYCFKTSDDLEDKEYEVPESTTDIYEWIKSKYRESRGSELPGLVNPRVLEVLFREQALAWSTIAHAHLVTIEKAVDQFNAGTWPRLVLDEAVRDHIAAHNACKQRGAMSAAQANLDLLLTDEMEGILQTVNHYFAENIEHIRTERVTRRLSALGIDDQYNSKRPSLHTLVQAAHRSNEAQAIYDIHDSLKAYYKVALKRFMDNVVLQCVERCFIGLNGPVKHITPAYIGSLDDEQLGEIAAESYASATARSDVTSRLERLEKALALAEKEKL